MNTINKYIKLIIGLCICLQSGQILATHVAGGTMTYRCLGGDRYEVTLQFRRDCFNGEDSAPFDDPATFGVYDSDLNLITFSVEDTNMPGVGIAGGFQIPLTTNDTLIETLTSECNVISGDVCIQSTIYRDTIRLPEKIGGYYIVYQRCCRNTTLQNVMEPLQTGATYWVRITDAALGLCNSSPSWDSWPDVYRCAQDTLDYIHSATDIDGDSLVYSICTPSQGLDRDNNLWAIPPTSIEFREVVFNPGFSLENMFGGGDPLTINSETGEMYAVPEPVISQFLVGVCVSEYRNGELLSEVRRDFEFNVRICGRAPVANVIPDAETKCNSLEIEFTNATTSNFLPFEDLDFTWIFDFPNETFTSQEISPTFTFPESGNYQVAMIADDGTCVDTAFVNISVATEEDPSVGFSVDAINCNPNTTIFLEANHSFTDTIPDENYMWTITANGVAETITGRVVEYIIGPDQEVTIELDVEGPTGCVNSASETMEIETVLNPMAAFDLDAYNCNSTTSIDLSSTVSSFETIVDSAIVWTIMANGTASIIYGPNPTFDVGADQDISVELTVNTPNGCTTSVTQEYTISTFADPTASFDYQATHCSGSTEVTLAGTASSMAQTIDPNSFNWTVFANNQTYPLTGANPFIDIEVDQIIIVEMEVSSIEGCTTTIRDTLQIATVPFEPIFTDVTVCPGEQAFIFQNQDPNTTISVFPDDNLTIDNAGNYIITNNQVTQSINILVDNGDCERNGLVNITVDTNPSFSELTDLIQCGESTVNLNPTGNSAYVYNWASTTSATLDNTAFNPSVSVPSTGDFFVTITTSPGSTCFAYDTLRVNRVEYPTIDVLPNNLLIYCENTAIDLIAQSNGDITWYNEGIIVGSGPNLSLENLTSSQILTVESINSDGCSTTESVELQFIAAPPIIVDAQSNENVCFGDPLTASIVSNDNIQWVTQDGTVINEGSELIIPELLQDTTLTIIATNDLGCQAFQDISFGIYDLPATSDTPLELGACISSAIDYTVDSQDSVTWFTLDGVEITTGPNLTIEDGLETSASYVIKYTTTNNCEDFDTLDITIFEELGLQINAGDTDVIYCQNFSPELITSANVASDIVWTVNGDQVGMGNVIEDFFPTGDFTIVATGTDASGCTEADSISVTESIVSGSISGQDTLCLGSEMSQLTYNPDLSTAYNIEWTPSTNTTSTETSLNISPQETTMYTAIYTNDNNCSDTSEFLVNVGGYMNPPIATTSKVEICLLESVDLDIDTDGIAADYLWSPASSLDNELTDRPTATPEETTTYEVIVTDELGCTAISSVTVNVILPTCTETDVFIPNMFTPNDDMENDVFKAESNFIESMSLVVYNRWGEEVYSGTDMSSGWDGSFKGEALGPDVYGYYFTAVCVNGLTYQKQGNVTLIK